MKAIRNGLSIFIYCVSLSVAAGGWDPLGDIQNPGRIVDNIVRETGKAGPVVAAAVGAAAACGAGAAIANATAGAGASVGAGGCAAAVAAGTAVAAEQNKSK